MFAQLGDIVFSGPLGPSSQEIGTSVNFAQHALIDGKPRLQRVGSNLDELKLSMRFHISFCTPEDEMQKLYAYRDSSEELLYITGTGSLIGYFVVRSVNRNDVQQAPNGKLIEVMVDVELVESFVPDRAAANVEAAKNSGFAFDGNDPQIAPAYIEPITPTAVMSKNLSETSALNLGIENSLKLAQVTPSQTQNGLKDVLSKAKDMKSALENTISMVTQTTGNIAAQLSQLSAQCANAIDFVETLQEAATAGSLQESLSAFDALQSPLQNVKNAGSSVSKINSSRIPITPING